MAARVLVLVGLGGLVGWTGCLEPNLTYCNDGRACSSNLVCDEVHHSCVTPQQLAACAGKADSEPCTTDDITGLCFDQVCVIPGCGNSVIEPGELCDDGNRLSGDGCSVDCRSTETCGNGVVDTTRGEVCDDGNLASHDGCNSLCGIETVTWGAHAIHLTTFTRKIMAFDPVRGRVVSVSSPMWEWDGAHWSVSAAQVPIVGWQAAAFDPIRNVVVAVGQRPSVSTLSVYAWNGGTMVEVPVTGTAPQGPATSMVWDDAHQKLIVLGDGDDVYLDLGTGAWSPLPQGIGPLNSQQTATYDPDVGRVVLFDASLGDTYEWDGATWQSKATVPRGGVGATLVYDATFHRLLAIGGSDYQTAVDVYTDSGWAPAGFDGDTRAYAFAWYDPTAHTVRVIGGGSEDMLVIDNDQKSTVSEIHPTQQPMSLAYDAKRAQLEMFDSQSVPWRWGPGSTWTALSPGPIGLQHPVYDPLREGVVAVSQGPTSQVVMLRDSWTTITALPPNTNIMDLTYDYANRQIAAGSDQQVMALPSNSTTWQSLPAPIWMPSPVSVAFDLGKNVLSALTFGADSTLYDLDNGTWTQSLSPGTGYRIVTEHQSRSLLILPVALLGTPRQMWERTNGVFKPLGYLPFQTSINDVAELPYGRMFFLGSSGPGYFMLERQLTSSLPDETCVAGEDADGDGAAGCADPDCWWSCWPACPVATSCP